MSRTSGSRVPNSSAGGESSARARPRPSSLDKAQPSVAMSVPWPTWPRNSRRVRGVVFIRGLLSGREFELFEIHGRFGGLVKGIRRFGTLDFHVTFRTEPPYVSILTIPPLPIHRLCRRGQNQLIEFQIQPSPEF